MNYRRAIGELVSFNIFAMGHRLGRDATADWLNDYLSRKKKPQTNGRISYRIPPGRYVMGADPIVMPSFGGPSDPVDVHVEGTLVFESISPSHTRLQVLVDFTPHSDEAPGS